MNDRLEVVLHLADRQPAQPVVGAERQDQQPHIPFERPVRAPQSIGRRVAGHAGVDRPPARSPPLSTCAAAAPDTPARAGSPSPAVRLSPSATMRGASWVQAGARLEPDRPEAAAVGDAAPGAGWLGPAARNRRKHNEAKENAIQSSLSYCRILPSVVTIAFQPALARARAALERGRHADAIGVLTQALKSSGSNTKTRSACDARSPRPG